MKYPWEIWDSRLEMVIDKVEIWATHIGADVISKSSEHIEVELPECLGVLRVEDDRAYVTGIDRKDSFDVHERQENEMRVFGREDGETHYGMYQIEESPKNCSITIDDRYASALEIHATKSILSSNAHFIKVEFYKTGENDEQVQNWSDMSEEEIEEYLSKIPESNHKKILRRELEDSGFL